MKLFLSVLTLLFLPVLSNDISRAYQKNDITLVEQRKVPGRFQKIPFNIVEVDNSDNTDNNNPNSVQFNSPSFKKFSGTSTKPLISVNQPVIDDCRRLWVLDIGIVENYAKREIYTVRNPALIAFDLDQLDLPEIHRYELTGELARTPSGYGELIVDIVNPQSCNQDETYVYITNFKDNNLIVYDKQKGDAWSFTDKTFEPERNSSYTYRDKEYTFTAGIFAITLGDRDEKGDRTAYYLAGSGQKLYSVNTKSLKIKGATLEPKLLGDRDIASATLTYDPNTKVIFFAEQSSVSCWNTQNKLESENMDTILTEKDFTYGTDIMDVTIDSAGVLWVLAVCQPPIEENATHNNKAQIILLNANAREAIKGKKCESKQIRPQIK